MSEDGRYLPQSDLDFSLMTTDSVWGKSEVPQDLKDKLVKLYARRDENGDIEEFKENLWGLLGFYSRDLRLANLSQWNGEVTYCQYFLDLANDFLQADQVQPFLICLSRVATVLELSQSKGGFLRRKLNTFTQENVHSITEPQKKQLFGGQKKKKGGYN